MTKGRSREVGERELGEIGGGEGREGLEFT